MAPLTESDPLTPNERSFIPHLHQEWTRYVRQTLRRTPKDKSHIRYHAVTDGPPQRFDDDDLTDMERRQWAAHHSFRYDEGVWYFGPKDRVVLGVNSVVPALWHYYLRHLHTKSRAPGRTVFVRGVLKRYAGLHKLDLLHLHHLFTLALSDLKELNGVRLSYRDHNQVQTPEVPVHLASKDVVPVSYSTRSNFDTAIAQSVVTSWPGSGYNPAIVTPLPSSNLAVALPRNLPTVTTASTVGPRYAHAASATGAMLGAHFDMSPNPAEEPHHSMNYDKSSLPPEEQSRFKKLEAILERHGHWCREQDTDTHPERLAYADERLRELESDFALLIVNRTSY